MMGPVSATLECDLREWVRRHGVVFFLDPSDVYSGFIDQLATATTALPYAVVPYRGSYLEVLFALENQATGVDTTPVVVHLPGFTPEDVQKTPLFEMYEAGKTYRKGLDTLITEAAAGRVRPDQIESYRNQGNLTLDGADAWLTALAADAGQGLAAQLQGISLEAMFDDLLNTGFVSTRLGNEADAAAVWDHFGKTLGLPASWRDESMGTTTPRSRDVAFAAASWALAVEYVNDLSRAPADDRLTSIPRLPKAVGTACHRVADHLRSRHSTFYEATANETESWLTDETSVVRAADLGSIDTFLFEETAILKAALEALHDGTCAAPAEQHQYFGAALGWAEPRAGGESFWLQRTPLRQNAWLLVLDAARLGQAMADAGPGLGSPPSLDAAVARYVKLGAPVDRAHRLMEQRRVAVLMPQLPHFEVLRARLDDLRKRWRTWADAWARDWNALCRAQGFLPSTDLQQRTLFDQVVKPSTAEPGQTAYFLVDALRFEMAAELFDALGELPATQMQLKARLAELPTVTEVGMNVLAPVCEGGRLKPAFSDDTSARRLKGFAAGEFRVHDPETRRRAMFERVGGKGCPLLKLDDVLGRDAASLKKTVEQARLIFVHSEEIDKAGEKGVGPSVFDKVLQDLRAAWRLLREAGVKRFVITADHGFLLLDDRIGDAKVHGRKIDPKRRHIFTDVAADHTGEARVALKDLGYDDVAGHLMFPETVGVFDTGERSRTFVHGGNSPQERVIPVLTLVHKSPVGSDTHQYIVTARAGEGIVGGGGMPGMHCVEARVDVAALESLNFGGRPGIELGLRVVDAPDVVVELCQVRRGGRLAGTVIHADVGADFEVLFRVLGSGDARVRVELCDTGREATVQSAVIDARFSVTPATSGRGPTSAPARATTSTAWLAELESPLVRQVFEHLTAHGTITETEAAVMLGGQREQRRFSREFETHAARAPFRVRIDVSGGIKRYVREGGEG
jgi:hypothetical protein